MNAAQIKKSAGNTASAAGKKVDQAISAAAPTVSSGTGALIERLIENRGFRVAVIGVAFVIAGLQLGVDSAWTVPVFIIGAILICAGVLGTRLSGRLAIEWGAEGASFEMRAKVVAPEPTPNTIEDGQLSVRDTRSVDSASDTVIESSGETIEIDLDQLREMLPTSKNSLADAASEPGDRVAP